LFLRSESDGRSRGLQDVGPFAGHSPDRERPLGAYAALTGTFLSLCAAFGTWRHRSDRKLPERIAGEDLVLAEARGSGLRRAIGELLVCPNCLGMWVSALFIGGLAVVPRPTRLVASLLVVLTGADVLQIAYKKAEDTL
jgi:hypothetical protein